jgi:hypothetical protein
MNITIEGIKAAFDHLCLKPIQRAFYRRSRDKASYSGACALGAIGAASLLEQKTVGCRTFAEACLSEDEIVGYLRKEIPDTAFRYGIQDGWDGMKKPVAYQSTGEEAAYQRGYKLGAEALALVTKERGLYAACDI